MNKNSKRIAIELKKARKAGNAELAIEVPQKGYHSTSKGVFQVRRIPILVKSIFKGKSKPFPKIGEPMGLIEQRKMLSY